MSSHRLTITHKKTLPAPTLLTLLVFVPRGRVEAPDKSCSAPAPITIQTHTHTHTHTPTHTHTQHTPHTHTHTPHTHTHTTHTHTLVDLSVQSVLQQLPHYLLLSESVWMKRHSAPSFLPSFPLSQVHIPLPSILWNSLSLSTFQSLSILSPLLKR